MTFDQLDVVIIPFPFVDSLQSKPRPVVVLTAQRFNMANQHSVAAMITTATHTQWLGDITIQDLTKAGLNHPSVIRMKLFTLDMRIKARKIGRLSSQDATELAQTFKQYFSLGN